MLNVNRLADKLKLAYSEVAEEANSDAARDRICLAQAQAIIDEIKQLQISITYTAGLVAGSVPVTGSFTYTYTLS